MTDELSVYRRISNQTAISKIERLGMKKEQGGMIISLDFEMYWGVQDRLRKNQGYAFSNLVHVPDVVKQLCQLFLEYSTRATWATVGLLNKNSLDEVLQISKHEQPDYKDRRLNPYEDAKSKIKTLPEYIFINRDLINIISATIGQEIASHTFSHFYTLELGQNLEEFKVDCEKFNESFSEFKVHTIVFPRNQVNLDYLPLLEDYGIVCYRGTQKHWAYETRPRLNENVFIRLFRMLDKYANLGNDYSFSYDEIEKVRGVLNIPQSRFFSPSKSGRPLLNYLRISRIKREMKKAAQQNNFYHLWWHPHNFGSDVKINMDSLRGILEYQIYLDDLYNWPSLNMSDVAKGLS